MIRPLLVASALGLVIFCVAARAQVTGQVSPERSAFDDLFAATTRLYPGQRLRIRVDGAIDANHTYWRDRECSWFGLSCKYVDREASNLIGVDRLPLLLALEPPNRISEPPQTFQPQWFNTAIPGISHLPASPSGTYDVTIKVADADRSVDAFSTEMRLRAMIADKYDAAVPINRGQCHNRPPVCSSSVYTVSLIVSNTDRLQLLRSLLNTRRGASEITDRKVLDPLFVQDNDVKPGIADALFQHAKTFYAAQTEDARRDYLRILSFASGLDPTRAEILNEMAATYIALGEFTAAQATVKDGFEAAKAAYEKAAPPRQASVVTDLSKALSLRASIWVQERGEIVATDLMIAVNLYRESAGYCTKEAPLAASAADKSSLYACAKDRLVDAGRTIAKLRTRENLILAEQLLSQAQEAARQAVDAN